MKVIKNEKGIFMELPRENIEFYGNTPEEKKMNEVIYDLSLENDSLYQQITQLTNQLKEFKEEHKIMKQILIENGLWERLLNDDRFLKYLRDDEE